MLLVYYYEIYFILFDMALRQKGLPVTGVFSRALTIEASVANLQPLVM
jgi:hypothetical protein